MKLSELLVDDWVVLPLEAEDLGEALQALLRRVSAADVIDSTRAEELARELSSGTRGELTRINDQIVAVVATIEEVSAPALGLGVSPDPFPVGEEAGSARAVLLLLVPGKLTRARQEIVPTLARVLRDPSCSKRLLGATSIEDVRAIREVMDVEANPRPLVEDALVPVRYRVYPDTPLNEVVDLMVRRGIHAVPVVGEGYEVLGILTSGDALAHMLRRGGRGEGEEQERTLQAATARDFMTRSVLCVSEDQALSEAANMMVNRDVEQIPVVREGELVGFVTRDSILRTLHGGPKAEQSETEGSESQS